MHFLNYFFLPSLHSSNIRSYRISLQLDAYFINTLDTRDIKRSSECYTRKQNVKMDPDRCNVSISASHDAILVFINNKKKKKKRWDWKNIAKNMKNKERRRDIRISRKRSDGEREVSWLLSPQQERWNVRIDKSWVKRAVLHSVS